MPTTGIVVVALLKTNNNLVLTKKIAISVEVYRLRDHVAETLKVSFTGISADLKISPSANPICRSRSKKPR